MTPPDVVIVGSANADLVLTVAQHVSPGETALALGRADHAGGKGLNQAVAAARAGARAAFIAAVGEDEPGRMLRAVVAEAGIDSTRIRTSDEPTGLAVVMVDEDGENSIIVASGANATLILKDDDEALVRAAKVLVLQLEVPLDTVQAAAAAAHHAGVRVVLNAAPSRPLPRSLLDSVDVLVVNEHEARAVLAADREPDDTGPDATPEALCRRLSELVPAVIVTLGAAGALLAETGHAPVRVAAPRATVVDTTGAGDTFTGALAAALAGGASLQDAAWFGSCAGSLAVETGGAVPSIPLRAAIVERQRTARRDGSRDPLAARPIDLPTPVPLDDADLSALDEAKILAAPADPALWPRWRERLRAWRSEAQARFAYDGSRYDNPRTAWTQRCWNVAMVWLWDEALYNWQSGEFDVDRLLATYADFGGLDAVVLWHAYPVIGIDPRNQFDYYRDVPGLRDLVESLQGHSVRVFVDYNPWDIGTRRASRSDTAEIASLVADIGADGVFLDTLKEGDSTLRDTLLALEPPPALEGESRVPTARIGDHQLSWAQWMADSPVPGVLRARWFEQRHMMHHTRRWNTDHADELQSAWINGVGVLLWDVVFGSYVGWSARDQSTVRAMRRVYEALGDHVVRGDWTPLPGQVAAEAIAAGVYGASYELDGVVLWTLVNRGSDAYEGALIDAAPDGTRWVDVLGGADVCTDSQGVRGSVPAHGIGGLVAIPSGARLDGLDSVLATARADTLSTDRSVETLSETQVPLPLAAGRRPANSITVPAGRCELTYRYRVRETGMRGPAFPPGAWKPLPPYLHSIAEATSTVDIGDVAVDPGEVTNADFAAFLSATGYRPLVPNRFLAHWDGDQPAAGTETAPVTYVDLDDARAYARWRGARLPSEAEWQLAASDPGWHRSEPLVWNWTESECRDGRTRWVFVKGGSWFAAEGSDWYVDGGPQSPDWSLRLLLLGGGLARSECIGFRCAVDLNGTEANA